MDPIANDIGARLRNAREQRGLTLRDIANTTKISTSALNAIEHNDFARLPGGVFRRAYVRTFAAEVGLNADELTREYRALFETEVAAGPQLHEESGLAVRSRALHWLAGALAAGFAVLLYGFVMSKSAEPAGESDDPQEVAFANAAVVETAAPALRLEIQLTGLCWVSAVADGERVVYRLMQPGERLLVNARDAITLRVGDAGAVAYSINDAAGRPLGQDGEAITVLITTEDLGRLTHEPANDRPRIGAAHKSGQRPVAAA